MAINRGSGISAGPGINSGSGIGGAGIAVVPAGGGPVSFDFSGGSLPVGAALTRSSIGTYFDASGVMQTATSDAARFDYTFNGSVWSLAGLLVEPQRTNYVANSAALSGYSVSGCSWTANDATAPDGTTTADKLTGASGASNKFSDVSASSLTGQNLIGSLFVKYGNYVGASLTIQTLFTSKNADVDYAAETISAASAVAAGKQDVNAFVRYWLEYGAALDNNSTLRVWAGPFVSGSGGEFNHFWGAQVEAGAFLTSHIPTSGSAATRSADVLTLTIPTGTYDMEAVTPTGTYQGPGISVTGGAYVFDWADFVGATTETRLTVLSATPA